ncbi:hypothetical protein EDD85DRAFT_585128 [Armillaria nabsnona]|nr:hypothetical protein EDD85DRAFT_585128 [Armillaria nabsnona]
MKRWRCLYSLTTDVDISVCSSISFIKKSYCFPYQDIGLDFVYRCMIGEPRDETYLRYGSDADVYISTLEQAIPVGSVGYVDPLSRKFIILFSAIDPTSSTEPRIRDIASLLEYEAVKLIVDPNYSPNLRWDCKHTFLTNGRAFVYPFLPTTLSLNESRPYDIHVGHGSSYPMLHLTLGRALARNLIGTHFDNWFLEHKQTIFDAFEDGHPQIRKPEGLELGKRFLTSK